MVWLFSGVVVLINFASMVLLSDGSVEERAATGLLAVAVLTLGWRWLKVLPYRPDLGDQPRGFPSIYFWRSQRQATNSSRRWWTGDLG